MAEPTKANRAGDSQPMPEKNDKPVVQDLVIDDISKLDPAWPVVIRMQVDIDIKKRKQLGIQRYGTYLQPNNGRDSLQDAYEECLDLVMYLKQYCLEYNESLFIAINSLYEQALDMLSDLAIHMKRRESGSDLYV